MTDKVNQRAANDFARLHSGFAKVANRKTFCTYILIPRPGNPGKMDKIPCVRGPNGIQRLRGSINAPSLADKLMTLDEAIGAAENSGGKLAGVGLVFREGCGIVGVDLDDCLRQGANSFKGTPEQRAVMSVLKDYAFAERSVSGTGLHLFALGDCRNAKVAGHVEVFGDTGFIALTGTGGTGTIRQAPPEAIAAIRRVVADLKGTVTAHVDDITVGRRTADLDADRFNDEALGRTDHPPPTVEMVREMLTYIPAAVSEGCDRDTWRNVLWGIRDGLGDTDEAREVALEWSKTSPADFDQQAFDNIWHSDRAQKGGA